MKEILKNKKIPFKWRIIIIVLLIGCFLYYENLKTTFNQYQRDLRIAVEANQNDDYKKAEEYYIKAIDDTSHKNYYPIRDLGKVYASQGEYSKAESLFKESLAICEKRYKPNDVRTIDSLYVLANFYIITGKYKDAEQLLEKATSAVGNEDMKGRIKLFEALGETYFLDKDYDNSEKFLSKALTLKKTIYKNASPELVKSSIELLRIFAVTNKLKEEQVLKQTIRTCESTNNCEKDQLISLYIISINLYMNKKDLVNSKLYADKALKLYSNVNIKNIHKPMDKILYLSNIAVINYAKGNVNKSLELLHQAKKISTNNFGKGSKQTQELNSIINEIKNKEV